MSVPERSLLCFGDSNTHGTCAMPTLDDMRRLGPGDRWPGVARGVLGRGWSVIEEGHPGRTTVHDDPIEGAHKNGATMLPAILETHRPIDIVAIMLGTNDLKARFSVGPMDISLSLERLADMVLGSRSGPGRQAPQILIVAPVPILEAGCLAEMFAGGAAKSRMLAGRVAEMAARRSFGFLDAGLHAAVDPLDGIHLDAAGHRALGHAIARAVADIAGPAGGA